jgi:MFS family permease
VGSAYLSERFPHRRGAVLSWHTVGGSIGTVAVPLFASAIIAAAGWRWALAAVAVLIAAGGLLVRLALPAEPHRHPDPAPGPATRPAGPSLWRVLLARRVALVLAASTVAAGGRGLGTISTYLPAYLKSGLHLGQITVGVVFTVVMAASVAGPVGAGYLADRVGRTRLLVGAYLGGAAALAGFAFTGRDLAGLLLTGVAVGVLAYAESPLLQAVFADAVGHRQGRAAFGAFFAIAYGVGALWLAVLGWVIDAFGFTTAFVVMAASFIAAAGLVALSGRPRRAAAARAGGGFSRPEPP